MSTKSALLSIFKGIIHIEDEANANMKIQERIKHKLGTEEPTRASKLASIINSLNQQNLKLRKTKSKQKSA
jgi:hypothetical protein